jgi:multiple sugar transport system permease protein
MQEWRLAPGEDTPQSPREPVSLRGVVEASAANRGARRARALPYLLLSPSMAAMTLIILYPIAFSVWMSLHQVDFLRPQAGRPFIGLDNYVRLFGQASFWQAMRVTFVYTGGAMVFSFLIGLGTALLLNENFRGRALARSIVILPWAVPYVAAILTWQWMLNTDYGVINYMLRSTGLMSRAFTWLNDPAGAMVAVLAVTIWTQYPFVTLMHLAGLQGVPREPHEAAMIDGAGAWARFRNVTWPELRPVNTAIILLLAIWNFRRFTIIYVMTGGGPVQATETLVIQTYRQAFTFFNMGYASAMGTVLLVLTLAFSLVYIAVQIRQGQEV